MNLNQEPSLPVKACIILLMALAFAAVVAGFASDLP